MAEQLIRDYRQADLSDEQRALCDFAVKLTLTPARMNQDDVDRLRALGFGDPQVTLATQIISYFNYINRIADGLGVDEETWMKETSKEDWEQQRGRYR